MEPIKSESQLTPFEIELRSLIRQVVTEEIANVLPELTAVVITAVNSRLKNL
jgi:hypothetical protein